MNKTRRKQSQKLTGMTFPLLKAEIGRLHYTEDIADFLLKLVDKATQTSNQPKTGGKK